jgi:hypothetical protein
MKTIPQSDKFMYKQRTYQRIVLHNTNFRAHGSKEDTFTNALGIEEEVIYKASERILNQQLSSK